MSAPNPAAAQTGQAPAAWGPALTGGDARI